MRRLLCPSNRLYRASILASCLLSVGFSQPVAAQHTDFAEHFALAPADCLMVGDSSNDIKAARAAGFQVVAVPYGYNHGVDIRESNPDLVIDNFRELAALFTRNAA